MKSKHIYIFYLYPFYFYLFTIIYTKIFYIVVQFLHGEQRGYLWWPISYAARIYIDYDVIVTISTYNSFSYFSLLYFSICLSNFLSLLLVLNYLMLYHFIYILDFLSLSLILFFYSFLSISSFLSFLSS